MRSYALPSSEDSSRAMTPGTTMFPTIPFTIAAVGFSILYILKHTPTVKNAKNEIKQII